MTTNKPAIVNHKKIVKVKKNHRGYVLVILHFVVAALLPGLIYAQTATITGEVRDADTGETLPGASLIIEGTSLGASTDINGRYTLRRVPVGTHTIIIRYMGYVTQEHAVTLNNDERLVLDIDLAGDLIEGDVIFVTAYQRGQARSLTRQRESVNIRAVISSEQMDRFADQTVSGSLQRIAGMGHGGANIRGIGAGASNITLDGQRMGTTGSDDRSVDLGTISADMVQEMDVIKVITPDMDADALSGVINISTRRPVGGDREVNVQLGGGTNSRFGDLLGPSSRASFSYGDSPHDFISYGINLSYQNSRSPSETLGTSWDIGTFDDGALNVLTGLSSQIELNNRERYGSALQFTFQPTDRSTFHVQGMFNYQERERMYYETRHSPRIERYTNPTTTGVSGGTASNIHYNSELREYGIHQYTFQGGGRHLFEGFDMEYTLGWGHGRSNEERYEFPFRTNARYDYIVDLEDRWYPTLELSPLGERVTLPERIDFEFQQVDHRWDYNVDNQFNGSLDFDIPFSRGTFKLGGSALMTYKDGHQERYRKYYDRRLDLPDFETVLNANWNVFDRDHHAYQIPWLLDLNKAKDWYYAEYPNFDLDIDEWAASAETNYYSANENTYGIYGMGTINIGRFRFLGGLRIEHTATRYDGRDGTISSEGRFRGAVDTSAVNNYTNFFPNAQVVYAISQMTNIRLAYSRSIGRPNFTQLSPYMLRNHSNERLTHGNPNLNPMLSNNLDLLFEHYFMNVGQFTVGLYYKDLKDFVFSYTEIIPPGGVDGQGLYTGWRTSTYLNGEEAMAYGLEISWQQNLSFLPGFLSYSGIYANYSYANSQAEVSGRSDNPPRLQGQRPHVVNAGLDYNRGAFSGQVSYAWGAASVSSYGDQQRVPEINPGIRVWFDSYRDAANDVSLTLRYRLTDHFRLWADASNLLNYRSVSYDYDRDLYPRNATLSGRTVNIGVRYSL